jgi:hypothetical protein
MTSYRGTRDSGVPESDSPESFDASVCGSTESAESGNEDVASDPQPKGGSPREFLGRSALRLMWMPVASSLGRKIT